MAFPSLFPIHVAKTTAAIVTAQTATASIDTMGYDFMQLAVKLGTEAAVSSVPTTLKLSESDITDATGYSDIKAFVGGTATDGFSLTGSVFTATSTSANVVFNVDLRGRKRYIKIAMSPQVTDALFGVYAVLARGEASPSTAARLGAVTLIEG